MKRLLPLLSVLALFACTQALAPSAKAQSSAQQSATAPQPPAAQPKHLHYGFDIQEAFNQLTPDERQRYIRAHRIAIKDPVVRASCRKAREARMAHNDQSAPGQSKEEQEMKAINDAAMLKADPSLAPVMKKFDEALKKMAEKKYAIPAGYFPRSQAPAWERRCFRGSGLANAVLIIAPPEEPTGKSAIPKLELGNELKKSA